MIFTGLHRAIGALPGPLTTEMVDEAIRIGAREADDLDWKRELPPAKGISKTDFPKDVAAMANAGGGVIVYGVEEVQKAATGRRHIVGFDEGHERALRGAAVTAISPPVFGLDVVTLGDPDQWVVAVIVPNSVDGPHLVEKGEHFGAPIRNDADTVWMRERQLEAMYRARFDERRYAHEALDALYGESVDGRDTDVRAWFVGVARPRIPRSPAPRLSREDARSLASESKSLALIFAGSSGIHPLEKVDQNNPRPGLRRWVLENTAVSDTTKWREAWASIHDDGSVTVTAAVGGHRTREGQSPGHTVDTAAIECAVADLLALLRTTAAHLGANDYEVRIGIEWTGVDQMVFQSSTGYDFHTTATMNRYPPILMSVRTDLDADQYYDIVYDVITDAVNQAGAREPTMMSPRNR